MSYIPTIWLPREGTNLNKFTKSGETASSVILTNAPDAITQAGTPITADAMNNIEAGIQETRGGPFPSPSEFTTGLTTPFGLAYDGTALYVAEWDSGKVKKINLSTGAAESVTTIREIGVFANATSTPGSGVLVSRCSVNVPKNASTQYLITYTIDTE